MRTPLEARKHWAAVLRTDRFKQGIGRLEYIDDNGNILNCCLGLACRLYMEDGGKLKTELVDQEYFAHKVTIFNQYDSCLPNCVAAWLGLDNSRFARFHDEEGKVGFLDSLNDTGTPFSEIAEIIDSAQLDTIDDDNIENEQSTPSPNN